MAIRNTSEIGNVMLRITNSPKMGLMCAVLATMSSSCTFVLAQILLQSAMDIGMLEVLLVRSFTQVVLLAPVVLLSRSRVLFGSEKWMNLFIISFTGYWAFGSSYWSLEFIPAAILCPLSATCPLFAIIFSYFILKEKCVLLDLLCGIMGLVGVIIIARPTFIFGEYGIKDQVYKQDISGSKYETNYLIGCTIALFFGMGKALMFTLWQKWARDSVETNSDQTTPVLYPSVFGCMLTPALMLFSGQRFALPKDLYAIFALFAVGIIAHVGTCCNALSLKTQAATVVSVIRNLDVVWSFLIQYYLFNIRPTTWSVVGSVIIVSSTIIVCFRKDILRQTSRWFHRDSKECNMDDEEEDANSSQQ